MIDTIDRFSVVGGGELRVVASEGRLAAFLKQFLSFLVVVPGHPSHGPFYLISGLLKSIPRFTGWGFVADSSNSSSSSSSSSSSGGSDIDNGSASPHKASVYVAMLPLLFAYDQRALPYAVPRVESNDVLYGGASDFKEELKAQLAAVVAEVLAHITAMNDLTGSASSSSSSPESSSASSSPSADPLGDDAKDDKSSAKKPSGAGSFPSAGPGSFPSAGPGAFSSSSSSSAAGASSSSSSSSSAGDGGGGGGGGGDVAGGAAAAMAGVALALLDRLASGLKLDLPASAPEARKGGASDPKGAGNKKIVSFLVRLIDIAAKQRPRLASADPSARDALDRE